jgi:putative FmdB family regulatory protein
MPLYEYQCRACEHRFEIIQKFSDPPAGACPRCGGAVQKLQSAPAFQFKGSGWYITDYARKDAPADDKPAAKAEETATKSAPESGAAAATSAGEAKPAAGKSEASSSAPADTPASKAPASSTPKS